jgi:hypothetical protein
MRYLQHALVLLALVWGCTDATTPSLVRVVPAEVRWVEWPFQVTSVFGESLRVVVYVPCGHPRISAEVHGGTLTVSARDSSPNGECLGVNNGMYESVTPLPDLNPDEPPELFRAVPYAVVATVRNNRTAELVPVILGQLELTFRPPFRPVRMAGGRVRLSRDGTGCSWAAPEGVLAESLFVIAAPALDSTGYPYEALLGGTFEPLEPPQCGRASGLRLSFAQVDLRP